MGVAFYSVLEYQQWGSYWSLGRLNIPRDYGLFSAIAFGEGGVTDNMPHPPHGLPADCSAEARELFFTNSEEVKEYLAISRLEDEEEISLEEYVEGFGEWALNEYRAGGWLPLLESYDHSWLNLNELKEALAYRDLSINKLSPAFRSVLAAMQKLAATYGAEKVRLVFGFGM